jgi:hypothetical protein
LALSFTNAMFILIGFAPLLACTPGLMNTVKR